MHSASHGSGSAATRRRRADGRLSADTRRMCPPHPLPGAAAPPNCEGSRSRPPLHPWSGWRADPPPPPGGVKSRGYAWRRASGAAPAPPRLPPPSLLPRGHTRAPLLESPKPTRPVTVDAVRRHRDASSSLRASIGPWRRRTVAALPVQRKRAISFGTQNVTADFKHTHRTHHTLSHHHTTTTLISTFSSVTSPTQVHHR